MTSDTTPARAVETVQHGAGNPAARVSATFNTQHRLLSQQAACGTADGQRANTWPCMFGGGQTVPGCAARVCLSAMSAACCIILHTITASYQPPQTRGDEIPVRRPGLAYTHTVLSGLQNYTPSNRHGSGAWLRRQTTSGWKHTNLKRSHS